MVIDKSLFNIGKYHYKRFRGASWLRIFYHNAKLGKGFNSESEAKSSNTKYKFSILEEVNDERYKFNGKYEFLLQFSERGEGFNWWRQTNFPLNEKDDDTTKNMVIGYENVSISWFEHEWGGLAKSILSHGSCVPCLIDGSIGSPNYHYAIGNYGCNGYFLDSTPSNEITAVDEVILWMRVPDIENNFAVSCKAKRIRAPFNLLF